MALILKRASASRPSGEWNDDDYDMLADGLSWAASSKPMRRPANGTMIERHSRRRVVVGRVMKAAASSIFLCAAFDNAPFSGMLQEFLDPRDPSCYIDLRIKSRADALANLLRPSKVDFPKRGCGHSAINRVARVVSPPRLTRRRVLHAEGQTRRGPNLTFYPQAHLCWWCRFRDRRPSHRSSAEPDANPGAHRSDAVGPRGIYRTPAFPLDGTGFEERMDYRTRYHFPNQFKVQLGDSDPRVTRAGGIKPEDDVR
jgi:hypothetical protein